MRVETHTLGSRIEAEPGERLNDCKPDVVQGLLRRHAWVYFSGFGATLEEFDTFAQRFGRSAPPRRMPETAGDIALGFHAEDAYNPWRPDALWFVCLAPGSKGGTPTDVLDGVQLLDDMDDKWRQFAIDNHVRYNQTWPAEQWQRAFGADSRPEIEAYLDSLPALSYTFDADGSLSTHTDVPMVVATGGGRQSFSNTMLHAMTAMDYYGMSLVDGSEVPQDFLDHVEKLALDRRIPLGWEQGDVAVIDNYRLMHRRGVYGGEGRDLRVIHGEEFFGSTMPETPTPVARAMKEVLQGELDLR